MDTKLCELQPHHIATVEGYARTIFSNTYIYQEIIDLIILFYTKPILLWVTDDHDMFDGKPAAKQILFCPAHDTYYSICDKLQILFYKHAESIDSLLVGNMYSINASNWQQQSCKLTDTNLLTMQVFSTSTHPFLHRFWNGRFATQQKIADTLQGHKYSAIDLHHNNRKVVIKQLYNTLIKSGRSANDRKNVHANIENEIRILTYLSNQSDASDGFCHIIDDWKTNDFVYYAMEFYECDLFSFVSKAFKQNGQMKVYTTQLAEKPQVLCEPNDAHPWLNSMRDIFRQLVDCVHWMHGKGICHLNLSLESTMIHKMSVDGLEIKIKIVDFGLSIDCKTIENDICFQSDKKVGRSGYMSPEVYAKCIYDARKADLWSLGVILFMILVGSPPYKRATTRDTAFKFIINDMLKEVLKHWRRLPLLTADAFDCIYKIFKYEKERIDMNELLTHPFVSDTDVLVQ